jgi:hypothetical protein
LWPKTCSEVYMHIFEKYPGQGQSPYTHWVTEPTEITYFMDIKIRLFPSLLVKQKALTSIDLDAYRKIWSPTKKHWHYWQIHSLAIEHE